MLHGILHLQGTRMLVLEFRQVRRECAEGLLALHEICTASNFDARLKHYIIPTTQTLSPNGKHFT